MILGLREHMKRRAFITLLGGAVAWPIAADAQQRDRLRLVALVMQYVESDPQGQLRAAAFRDGLEKAGWVAGRNIASIISGECWTASGPAASQSNCGNRCRP